MKLAIGIFTIFLASLVVFSCDPIGNCGDTDTNDPLNPDYDLSALKSTDSCEDMENELKENLIKEMERRVDENLELALINYSEGCRNMPYPTDGATDDATSGGSSSSSSSSGGSSGSDSSSADAHSETNTQVPGVDEADFVKNDGANIYILSGDQFTIVDAWPPESAAVISSTTIEGTAKKLYVFNDKVLVYSSIGDSASSPYGYSRGECTYGYDCDFTGDGLMLKITVFDIGDLTAPELEREILFSGSYLNSRRIDSIVYTAVVFPEIAVEKIGVDYWPEEVPYCPYDETDWLTEAEITTAFTKLKARNRLLIDAMDGSELLPGIKDIRYTDDGTVVTENVLDDCSGSYLSQSPEGRSMLSLVSLKIDALNPLSATTIAGKPGAIYGSKDSLYVAARQYRAYFDNWYYADSQDISEATTVHKFNLSADTIRTQYAGSGVVKGRVLNQFSMDEFNGYLRMATTTGHLPDTNTHSTLLTLKEEGGKLVVTGTVDDIAPAEDIRAARFNGEKAFVVTFKKTDPLFAFDLSDPENPVITGELKIPGFSTYIHLMDDTHLLTIGYDAEDNVTNAYFQGIMLQIFDVSDMSAPVLTHKEVIGTRGSTSDAATNHLAFNYFAPKDLLALPMVVCEERNEDTAMWAYGDVMTFSGLIVYQVTTQDGFSYLGGISHESPETADTYTGYCNNWWTRSNSIVKRSIIMDDYVYSVALDAIGIAHVDNLDTPVAQVNLMP